MRLRTNLRPHVTARRALRAADILETNGWIQGDSVGTGDGQDHLPPARRRCCVDTALRLAALEETPDRGPDTGVLDDPPDTAVDTERAFASWLLARGHWHDHSTGDSFDVEIVAAWQDAHGRTLRQVTAALRSFAADLTGPRKVPT